MERAERGRTQVLVIEDDAAMRELLQEALTDEGFRVDLAPGGRLGIERVRAGGVDLVVTDVKMPDLDGLDVLREIRAVEQPPHVIVITAFGSIETAIKAVKLGAHDYITKPFEIDALVLAVGKALEERGLRREVARLRREVERPYRFENIIGRATAMQEVFGLIRRLAGSAANVLITGESGTGKELVARAIHYNSPRAKRPFVAVNCAAIPDALLESELFGYKRGAFTDARSDHPGMFVEADGGTLFLDEVGDLSPPLQAKLLRVLQEREIERVGGNEVIKVDTRVVAATNRDLAAMCEKDEFRPDLYDRLNVLPLHIPPLRARREDIPGLALHFLALATKANDRAAMRIDPEAMQVLAGYSFPGNVRELKNLVERLVILTPDDVVSADDVRTCLPHGGPPKATGLYRPGVPFRVLVEEAERVILQDALAHHGGQMAATARALDLERSHLYKKARALGLRGADKGDEE